MGKRGHLGRWLSRDQERGSELVEFSLIVIPLLLLLFGIIQYAFIFAANMTLRNASVVAARFATVAIVTNDPTVDPTAQIQDVARQAVKPLLNPSNVTPAPVVKLTNVVVGTATGTTVQISYKLPLIIPWVVLGQNISSRNITLTATSFMR